MTSEVDTLKTNEYKRRRKLRLQQVREQSNDIAKKIRQRANKEKSRQSVDLHANKQKEYFQRQERLVKQLQEFYTKGISNVGTGHRSASELKLQDKTEYVDISKQRGKEAAAELRRIRQEKLDVQKKLLDRKLLAREAANEVSREKSAAVANKILIPVKDTDVQSNPELNKNGNEGDGSEVKCNDMATQWDLEPSEWEPNIPTLALHKDDKDSLIETNNNVESKSDKSKRPDLFALSEEMPSSLRGGLSTHEDRAPTKSALTLVSEYLQNRGLRLRQTDTSESIKNKNMDELHSLKQTILRTRSSKAKGNNIEKETKSSKLNSAVPKKSSVTMYNHSTRNVHDIPHNERLVVRDLQADDDAYSQAMKESSTNIDETHWQKAQEVRSKVAMTKQNIEKEYKDTMLFLNSLPKDMGNKPIRRAFMDVDRQQSLKDNRQQKLQQEYKKIVKDCKKHSCRSNRGKSKSPSHTNEGFDSTDFQYSWMPVPESDGNLAIHAIPTSLKEAKAGNTVKFSKVDSYHEYRSRHKHTPPTRDTQQPKRIVEAVLIQNTSDSEQESVLSETSTSNNIQLQKKDNDKHTEKLSDAERIIIYKILDSKNDKSKNTKIMRDIAKSLTILQKQNEESQSKTLLTKNKNVDSDKIMAFEELKEGVYKTVNDKGTGDNIASMYYPNGGEKIQLTQEEIKFGRPCRCSKNQTRGAQQDQGTTSHNWESGDILSDLPRSTNSCGGHCLCGCRDRAPKSGKNNSLIIPRIEENTDQCSTIPPPPSAATSTSSFKTATDKNKTPANDKPDKANNALPDGGFIKLIDEGGEEAGKFYIGTSGFLTDDKYEVVIQLRKKGDETVMLPTEPMKIPKEDFASRVSVSVETPKVDTPFEILGVNASRSVSDASNLKTINRSKSQDAVVNIESVPIIAQPSSGDINQLPKDVKDVSEKGVSTSFQDAFAIPSDIPKSESNPRPATSAYTQTSMSSPVHRPMLFHMSSSTSTAYMSPPEMILPKFLIPDHRMSEDDLYDPRNFEIRDKLVVTDEQEYSENYECNCRKCRLARKVTLCKTNAHHYRKPDFKKQMATPPNTANHIQYDFDNIAVTDSNIKEICQCRKCSSRNRLNKPSYSNRHFNKNTATKHYSQNLKPSSSTYSVKKDKHKKRNNTNLNPIVREYVNKLLALNKESLKAVQVLDQDCSSVATPGSSIINLPENNGERKSSAKNKISLEQIKTMLKQQILDECIKKTINKNSILDPCLKKVNVKTLASRKKPIHKVKSLNISKHLFRTNTSAEIKTPEPKTIISSSSSAIEDIQLKIPPLQSRSKIRSKSIPTPRLTSKNPDEIHSNTRTNVISNVTKKQSNVCTKSSKSKNSLHSNLKEQTESRLNSGPSGPFARRHRAVATSTSPNSETSAPRQNVNYQDTPTNMSTQTSINVDSEINFLRFDEDKIQNMEKIADLTEKCTKRLSNLAKVLEEVRRNKSLAYSQISTSDTASDSDQKSDSNANKISANVCQPLHNTQKSSPPNLPKSSEPLDAAETNENGINVTSDDFVPFLSDIPRPVSFKTLNLDINYSSYSSNKSNPASPVNDSIEHHLKGRGKPPPALSRIHLKHVQDNVIPHELSTVVEVDSPMSVKLKSQSSRNDTKLDVPDSYNRKNDRERISSANPDILVRNIDIPEQTKLLITESSDDSKVRMIDMNQFNEIMLKPFFSLQEYAKHHNVGALDDGSNLEDYVRNDLMNDELSSLHSDVSLPDVISELLKRNIISEPFKFDIGSNVNSTTMSSESTLSVLALSKSRKEKKKSSVMFQKKENVAETSDTLSISSNPDLENAFKKLGMGWASSTLKKTKERLALSSSSNTSSSSLSQHKVKSFNHEIPALVTDTVSSVLNLSGMKQLTRNATDAAKNAEQQTLLTNSMTVKEFLTNELAKKITFNNNSKNETEEEFVSLFETKMPEEMKITSRMGREESIDNNSMRSGNGNRARTSTPVQLFKSMTYQSSSSSNVSNGLFSNADDLSSVKQHTSNSMKHSTSDKDDLTIPNFSLRMKDSSK